MAKKGPVAIIIRDGWGFRKNNELNGPVKGITPYTDMIMEQYPNTLISAASDAVGLPEGFQGNSEVGHLTIGSGRIINQPFVKINKAIEDGSFYSNKKINGAIENCKKNKTSLHVMGLLQKEGVHAHINHCLAILETCRRQDFNDVNFHIFTDGRDAPVNNSINNVRILKEKINETGIGKISTISGRYYAMDRDKRWDRTKKAYDCIIKGKAVNKFKDPIEHIEKCYNNEETDEFIIPSKKYSYEGVNEKDSIIFFNYRIDRPRQLTKAIIEEEFEGWERKPLDVHYVSMTEYYSPMDKKARIAFPPERLINLLGEVVSKAGMKQLRISETEKYAHVTFFFNGQVEEPYENEERILIHSPKVETYDQNPEMSVNEIGNRIIEELDKEKYDLIVVNFVNGDMVGHTGDWDAVLKAVNSVDKNLEKVCNKILEKKGTALIFADHGNCEDMTEEWRTSHTTNKVPFILLTQDEKYKNSDLYNNKGLKDIAPTALDILGIEKPMEMEGESIIKK
ncbi:MAG: 2,3-bisphosphoglycerate-independent phosphoglycerate mutase [Nanobdellota archaeon]